MEGPSSSPGLITALYILIPLAIAAIALWKGERARAQQAESIARARTRRTYLFFIPWAAFVLATCALALLAPDSVEVIGIAGGFPAAICALVALFHALMVWRVPSVALLLVATSALALAAACSEFLPASRSAAIEPWLVALLVAYGPICLGISMRGLMLLRRAAASEVRAT